MQRDTPDGTEDRVLVETVLQEWSLPLYFSLARESNDIHIELTLAKMNSRAKLDGNSLVKLLQANDNDRRMNFVCSQEEPNLVLLKHTISNQSVTPDKLRETIDAMTGFAINHAKTWSKLQAFSATTGTQTTSTKLASKSSASKTAASLKRSPTAKLTLLGLWSARITDREAFAIRIQKDGRFQLIHVKSGQSKASNGKATRSGNQLTLKGDEGVTIVGTVIQTTNQAFRLDINGSDGKVALSVNFERSQSDQ